MIESPVEARDFLGRLTDGKLWWILILVPLFLVVFAYFISWASLCPLVEFERGLVTGDDDGLAPYKEEGLDARSSR